MKWLFRTALYLRMCLRNIMRNRRRTLITIASIFVGTASLIMVTGYIHVMEMGLHG